MFSVSAVSLSGTNVCFWLSLQGLKTAEKPPPYYVCKRCEKTGHFVKDCPTLGDPAYDQKKYSVGIPTSQTRVISEAEAALLGDGVMRLPDGRLVLCEPSEYVQVPFCHADWSLNWLTASPSHRLTSGCCYAGLISQRRLVLAL